MKISNNLHWPHTAGQLSFKRAVKRNQDLDKSPELEVTNHDIRHFSRLCLFLSSFALHLPKHVKDDFKHH